MSLSGRELAERLDPAMTRSLRAISAAMGAGIGLLAAIVVFFHVRSQGIFPTAESVRLANLLTMSASGFAVATIVASELLWKALLKGAEESNANARLRTAFVVRTAAREGGALLGGVAALLAANAGVLRIYPAYWTALAPAVLFWSYLYLHWPSYVNLKAELRAVD